MARRTFIGNIYRKVKDPNLVSALSGHKEGSKAFVIITASAYLIALVAETWVYNHYIKKQYKETKA